ncbi:MAG: methionine synthase [Dehalococcoidia bacterium]|nr:methionine synthase [Dehalococcoidia bacterium]
MRKEFEPNGLATAIGSMPHINPEEACSAVLDNLPDIPAWPQLPRRSFLENMYVQFSEDFPGIKVEEDRIWVDRAQDLNGGLERLYADYLENRADVRPVSYENARGLHVFLDRAHDHRKAVKGQITGPVSFGLAITDQDRRPLLYDDALSDAVAKHLRLKAAWQERTLRSVSKNPIISVDEPYLASLGSAFIPLSQERVVVLLEEVLGGISGLRAIHCCGNTDWSTLLRTSIDILSLDAYNYGETLSLYASEVEDFLRRGGIIAWGVVPTEAPALARESAASLLERLGDMMKSLAAKGVSRGLLNSRCLITPSCGLGSLSVEEAEKALRITAEVSAGFRQGSVRN